MHSRALTHMRMHTRRRTQLPSSWGARRCTRTCGARPSAGGSRCRGEERTRASRRCCSCSTQLRGAVSAQKASGGHAHARVRPGTSSTGARTWPSWPMMAVLPAPRSMSSACGGSATAAWVRGQRALLCPLRPPSRGGPAHGLKCCAGLLVPRATCGRATHQVRAARRHADERCGVQPHDVGQEGQGAGEGAEQRRGRCGSVRGGRAAAC